MIKIPNAVIITIIINSKIIITVAVKALVRARLSIQTKYCKAELHKGDIFMKRKGVLRYKENTKIIEYSLNINLSVVATKITFQFLSGMYCFAKSTGQSNLLSLSR